MVQKYSFFPFCLLAVIFSLLYLSNMADSSSPSSSSPSSSSSSSSSSWKINDCNGSIADCYKEENEILMESEISRRIMEEKKYISPGALKRDQPVCNGGSSGQSYSSSCLPPPSNPQTRGCSKYYRCRSDS